MKNSDCGFTYPLTLCLLLLFLLFFSSQIDKLLTERKLLHESVTILKEEYYFLSSVRRIENLLQFGGTLPSKSVIPFTNGTMDYVSKAPVGATQEVTFTLQLQTGERVTNVGFFNLQSKTIVKWVEN